MTARSRRFKFIAKRADVLPPVPLMYPRGALNARYASHILPCGIPGQFQLKGTKSLAASLLSKGDRAENISPNTGRSSASATGLFLTSFCRLERTIFSSTNGTGRPGALLRTSRYCLFSGNRLPFSELNAHTTVHGRVFRVYGPRTIQWSTHGYGACISEPCRLFRL